MHTSLITSTAQSVWVLWDVTIEHVLRYNDDVTRMWEGPTMTSSENVHSSIFTYSCPFSSPLRPIPSQLPSSPLPTPLSTFSSSFITGLEYAYGSPSHLLLLPLMWTCWFYLDNDYNIIQLIPFPLTQHTINHLPIQAGANDRLLLSKRFQLMLETC